MRSIALIAIALPLAACAAYEEPASTPAAEPTYTCDAAAVQGHIGHTASADMGAAIQLQSGARTLRWGPPDSAWTMDYRPDRVNVRYDNAMKITEITCG
ncbi:I78 family peptidase inhibitor [Qipengyuania soli]|nr:I78 family peptidase inhibitor [Qipengyuania soli]